MAAGQSGRALVLGGDSLVGSTLLAHYRRLGRPASGTSRRPGKGPDGAGLFLDLAAPDLPALDGTPWQTAVVCAAITSMQACEADPDLSWRVNVDGTLAVMRRLAEQGTAMVFVSSSQVFDGETPMPAEDAPTAPKNAYGRQKLAVEQAIAREGLPAAILRVSKVLADRPVGVFKGWSETLARGQPVVAASNMALSPIMVADVAEAARRLADGGLHGTWHLGASDQIGYDAAALLMAERLGLPPGLVRANQVTEAEVPGMYRHRHVAMDCRKIEAALGMPIRSSRDILETLFAKFPDASGPSAEGRG